METLDNPRPTIDESTVPFLPTALRYGVIGGLISVTFGLIANLTGLSTPTSIMGGILIFIISLVIVIGIGYVTIRHHRENELGGYITFKRGFQVAFVALLISTIINSLWSVLYMTVIDPGAMNEAMAATEEMLSNFGIPQSEIDKQLEEMEKNFTVSGILKNGLVWGSIFAAVVTAIQSAIMKSEPPVV
jgi:hypothetical protein